MRKLAVVAIPPSSPKHQEGVMRASYKLSEESKTLVMGLSVGDYQPFLRIGQVRLTIEDITALLETKPGGARELINHHLENGSNMIDLHLTNRISIEFGWMKEEAVITVASRSHPQERCNLDYAEWNTLCLLDYCITAHLNRLLRCSVNAKKYIQRLFNTLFEREFEKLYEDTCDPPPFYQFYSDCCIVMKRLCERILDHDEYLFLSEMCLYHLSFLYDLYRETPVSRP